MRKSVKFRVGYLVLAIICYVIGSHLMPESLDTQEKFNLFSAISVVYFLILPIIYWICVINIGKQKKWKIILSLSLSSLIARFTFPEEFAQYFEFIMWVRYPIIAIILALELYLIVSVVRSLWQLRGKSSGDPRISILNQYHDEKEEKRSLALALSYEPSSWFYAIPYLSRNHPNSLAHIKLNAGKKGHWLLMVVALCAATTGIYMALVNWSELAAIVISSFIGYSIILLTANYRLSKHHSLYLTKVDAASEQQLVINDSFWGNITADLSNIKTIEQGSWNKEDDKERITFGAGKTTNVEIVFNQPLRYYSSMGMVCEEVESLRLNVDDPTPLLQLATTKEVSEAAVA